MSLSVRWFDSPDNPWGHDWLTTLIPGLTSTIDYHVASDAPEPVDGLVITQTSSANKYIDELIKAEKNFGVILLSDECLAEPMTYINSPYCKFVARNYFTPSQMHNRKVVTFGLGYKNGFSKHADPAKPAGDRKYTWSFAGSLKSNRDTGLALLSEIPNHKVHLVDYFNSPDYISTAEYAQLLSDSIFAPAPPGGASNDSFRIYEALEAGAIPITLRWAPPLAVEPTYWHAVFPGTGALPFISAHTWEEACSHVRSLLNSDACETTRQNCLEFWAGWKQTWRMTFELLLDQI